MVARQDLVVAVRDDGVDPTGDGHGPERNLLVAGRDGLEGLVGQRRSLGDGGRQDLHLAVGDVDDDVARAHLQQAVDLLGG